MKKIIIALAMIGLTATAAEAQTCVCHKVVKKVAHVTRHKTLRSTTGDTYQVCHEENGYYTCCVYKRNGAVLQGW